MRFAVVAHRRSATNVALVEAAGAWGADAAILSPREALRLLEPGDVALGRLDVRAELDGIESGTSELERLAAAGVAVLNRPGALVTCHDKLLTARALRLAGLPHPHTWLLTDGMPTPAPELPAVLKPRFGSWGREVILCQSREQFEEALEQAACKPWFCDQGVLVQELVPPHGWDLRLVVAAGRVVGAARRIARPGEWRTNAALGARVEPDSPPPLARTLALAAGEAVRADLAGVDLLPTRNGYVILEVNGAVDFRREYSLDSDVYAETIRRLLQNVAERPQLAGASL